MKANLKDLELELWLRRRSAGTITWTTREGTELPITSMTDTHLLNTIAMLQREELNNAELSDALSSYPDELFF